MPGLTYLFITHDLEVARHISQRIAVMYLGAIVEESPTERLFDAPLHPYTQALLAAAPKLGAGRRQRQPAVRGDLPNAIERPTGCRFHPRCPLAMPICSEVEPPVVEVETDRVVACHLYPTAPVDLPMPTGPAQASD